MLLLLALLTLALLATAFQSRRSKSPLWKLLVVLEAVALMLLAPCARQKPDPAKPYQVVFRASGFGLGQLVKQTSPNASGSLLVLISSGAEVEQWRVAGLEKGLSGTSLRVGKPVVLPLDLQSGCFEPAAFAEVLAAHPQVDVVVAFGGLGKMPAAPGWGSVYVFHPHGVDGMRDWWSGGRLKAVIAPAPGAAPPSARDSLEQVFASFFTVRTQP